jgi:hypothetical protein
VTGPIPQNFFTLDLSCIFNRRSSYIAECSAPQPHTSRVPPFLRRASINLARLDPNTGSQTSCRRISKFRRRGWKDFNLRPWERAMILRKQNAPPLHLATPSPDYSPRCSINFSDCDADDEDTMSAEEAPSSRPPSESISNFAAVGPYCPRIPTLHEVLDDVAPPPWSLSAFTAYLSQNHCLETLEFVTDASRYKEKYDEVARERAGMPMTPGGEDYDELKRLWRKLIGAYIVPNSPREVNLPSDVRDRLLSLSSHHLPPAADELNVAVQSIYELMDDSVLMPFISEASPTSDNPAFADMWTPDSDDNMTGRMSLDETFPSSRPRRKPSLPTLMAEGTPIPYGPAFNRLSQHLHLGKTRLTTQPSSLSMGSGDAMLTDDSGSPSSPSKEPMTPPTTPPSSEMGGSSPKNRNDNSWKKMIGRLGSKKKSTSRMGRIEDEGSG